MSYTIILDRRFIRFNTGKFKGIVPLCLMASSNVYEGWGSNRRARNWYTLGPSSMFGNKFWVSEKDMMPAYKQVTGSAIVRYRSDWLSNTDDNDSFVRFCQNGIDAALTMDELNAKYANQYFQALHFTCVIQYEIAGNSGSYSCIAKNNDEFNNMMTEVRALLETPDIKVIKTTTELNSQEPLKLKNKPNPAKAKKRPANEEPTFFTIKHKKGHYLVRLLPSGGYQYTFADQVAKDFRTKAAAQKWLSDHLYRLNEKDWEVCERHRYLALHSAFADKYDKIALSLEKAGLVPHVINHFLHEANYKLRMSEDNVSKAFASSEDEKYFRVWQFSKGVYDVDAFVAIAKSNSDWYRY